MRPPVWQLLRDAIQHFNREVTYSELKQFVWAQYPDINTSTLTCQIIVCSVNHPSRIHYPENKKPRACTSQYDFLYHTGRGRVAPYSPEQHGLWEIHQSPDGTLSVRLLQEPLSEQTPTSDSDEQSSTFALEGHLRDYLARNLANSSDFGTLTIYTSQDGRDGVEFQTDVGPIDILATAPSGDFHVFELKLGRGPDNALGQILRYMGWVSQHLAKDKKVFGVIVASEISEKLRYAVTLVPNVRLMEYELHFVVRPIERIVV
jgi:endonuclease